MTNKSKPFKRSLAVIAVLLTAALLSAAFVKIRGRSDDITRPIENVAIPSIEAIKETNLLFKSEAEIEAASPEERLQATIDLYTYPDTDDFATIKAHHLLVKEHERKVRERDEATTSRYFAMLEAIEQRRKERAEWEKAHAEWKRDFAALDKEILEDVANSFRLDRNGKIIAYKTRHGVFRPVSELEQGILWEPTSDTDTSADIWTQTDAPIETSLSDPILDAPQTPQTERADSDSMNEVASFIPDTFRETFTDHVSEWHSDINDQYLDVILAPHFSQQAFDEYFPTADARVERQSRQADMHAEIAHRVERFLTEDPGNRAEKLAIIRQTLTENYSPDIAAGVLEHLREE